MPDKLEEIKITTSINVEHYRTLRYIADALNTTVEILVLCTMTVGMNHTDELERQVAACQVDDGLT